MEVREVSERLIAKLRDWGSELINMLPNLAVAILVLVAFWLLSKLARKLSYGALRKISSHTQVNTVVAQTVRLAVLATGLFIALGVLQLDKTVTSLLAGVGVMGLALSFAFKDIASNFMSGIILALRRPFRIGHLIETNDHLGKVQALTMRATLLKKMTGQLVYLPNTQVLESAIINYTEPGERRLDLEVGVSYGDDLEKVKNVTLTAVKHVAARDESRELELFFTEFGDSSINFVLRMWLTDTEQRTYMAARSDAVMAIKNAYDENDITIPFPIRTLDFGIVGGEKLDEALNRSKLGDKRAA